MESKVIKEIREKADDALLKKIFSTYEKSALDVGICDIDIQNALRSMSDKEVEEVMNTVSTKKAYTNVYLAYGYQRVFASSKEEALKKGNKEDIKWNKNILCLKAAPTRYLHEFRYQAGAIKKVTHCYRGKEAMSCDEVCDYIKTILPEPLNNATVDYTFIVDGIIIDEKTVEL